MENGTETSSSFATSLSPPPLQVVPPPHAPPRPTPVREDCWSEEATHTLIKAWGERYVGLSRGNLRQKHWQEVADAVNALHGHSKKTRRTDIQCKNRIDTLKKKYKIEKARDVDSRGAYLSPWPFFSLLDTLVGDTSANKISPPPPPAAPRSAPPRLPSRKNSSTPHLPPPALALTSPVPVGPRSAKPKRPVTVDDSFLRRHNFSTAAAAAAATADDNEDDEDTEERESETSRSRSSGEGRRKRDKQEENGCRKLAEAILRFGEIYERVEVTKQEQLIELEKHRMQFAKDLEYQRMKLLMDTQVQLAKVKRPKPSDDDDAVQVQCFPGVLGLQYILCLSLPLVLFLILS
ncbi:hypothetical protein Dimus_009495 [Dionaea muscipula]